MTVTYARRSLQCHVPHSGEESASGSAPRSKQRGELRHLWEAHRLILSNIPTTVQIGTGGFEGLQISVDGSELLSQKRCLPWLRKRLVYSRSDLRANFGNGKPLRQYMCDMLERPRRRLGGEKSYKRYRAGISKLISCGVMEGK